MKATEIEVRDVGPVPLLRIPIQAGVVRLQGRNGSGKSQIIQGVSQLLGADSREVSASDGAQAGSISIGSATLRVTRSKSRTIGTLEVTGIESKLDISELVDPGIDKPEAADAKRLKALISLSGREADEAIFYPLVDGSDAVFASLGVETSKDPIILARRVKDAFERQARGYEQEARKFSQAAEAAAKSLEGIDLDGPSDEKALTEAYAQARSTVDQMLQHNEHATDAKRAADAAQKALDELGDEAENPDDLESQEIEIRKAAESHRAKIQPLKDSIARIEQRIAVIEQEARDENRKADDLRLRRAQAEKIRFKRERLRETAAESLPTFHSPDDLTAAQAAVQAAQDAINRGAEVRLAKKRAEQAAHDAEIAKSKGKAADDLRRRAAGVDPILSSLIPEGCPLRYEGGRLVVATDRGQSELFSDLSHGERWKLAIDFAASALGANGLLTVKQEGWESLDPINQRMIHDLAVAADLVILTAEATDSELQAIPYVAD